MKSVALKELVKHRLGNITTKLMSSWATMIIRWTCPIWMKAMLGIMHQIVSHFCIVFVKFKIFL